MRDSCFAAGNIAATDIQRKDRRQIQIGSLLNSVGGIAASFLSKQSVTLALPTLPGVSTTARTTSTTQPTTAASSARNSAQTSVPTTLASSASPATSNASQASAQSTSSPAALLSKTPGPSTGVIVGAVIGALAILILLGILIMLVLRHKRKKRQHSLPSNAAPAYAAARSHHSLDETLVERTPMVEQQAPAAGAGYGHANRAPVGGYMQNEKDVYRSSQKDVSAPMPHQNEMATTANVWELDGTERPRPMPSELESPAVERGAAPPWGGRAEAQIKRHPHEELHF
jgi:hypothetical protein